MFFEGNRIDAFREMICSETVEEREAALAKILPEQQGDFEKLYEALEGNPVTIRFLDPPLHEFVPTEEAVSYTHLTNYNLAFASYLLALLPILLFYLICQKHILNGVVNGAVK